MHNANCMTLADVLFTTLIESLRRCYSAEVEIVLNLFTILGSGLGVALTHFAVI